MECKAILFILQLCLLMIGVSSSTDFANPNVTMKCFDDTINLVWYPVHKMYHTIEEMRAAPRTVLQYCVADVRCDNGFQKLDYDLDCYPEMNPTMEVNFTLTKRGHHCSVLVLYRDFYDYQATILSTRKDCHFQFIPIDVTINTTDEQIVGQSFTLECRIQRAVDLIGTFDIIWTVQHSIEVRSTKNIPGSLISNYTDIYTISELRRSDYLAKYCCDVIVNLTQQKNVSTEFEINNLTQPPELIISPKQSPLRVTVGGHLPIYCTAVRGFPIPVVQWYSEGFPVYPSQSSYQQVYIVPTDSSHTTTYTCVETRYFYPVGVVSELRVNVTVIVEEPCPRLQAPDHGEITITEDGQLAFFSCNHNFTMTGSSILKCRNRNWDASTPSCHPISCN